MATLTIRGLEDDLHRLLRISAAHHGRSMEAEARAILRERLAPKAAATGLGSRIHDRIAALGGVDLELPDRNETARSAVFDE